MQDILESIEKGVEEERNQGTLQPQEVEVSILIPSIHFVWGSHLECLGVNAPSKEPSNLARPLPFPRRCFLIMIM